MHDRTRRRRRQSDYGHQLCEKQKGKRMYGMRERQFRRLYKMAQWAREETGVALLKLLEQRLDNVIYRLGSARTRPQARQFVNHGHVLVDERRVDIPSYLVKPGQVVALREVVRQNPDVRDLLRHPPSVPGWLKRQDGIERVVREPKREEIDQATLTRKVATREHPEHGHFLRSYPDRETGGYRWTVRAGPSTCAICRAGRPGTQK
jgi:small subunit ribosomal protein S4